ncbi:MAG: LysR family transcriptional regulator [Pseudomonadota bacterium]
MAGRARNTQRLEWSDIPYVLAVCEAGSLAGAARILGVNHSTVFRRIDDLEDRLGVRLFERQRRGYVMTPAGELFYERAAHLSEGLNEIELELGGRDLRLEGRLTVTTTDSLLHVLTPIIARFQADHPDVELRVLSYAQALDLSRRDADIALRPTTNPPEHWVGRKLAAIHCAAYSEAGYLDRSRASPEDQQRWIMLDDDLEQSPMSRLTLAQKHRDAPVTTVNTVMGVYDAVRAGLGLAVLPTYLGDGCDTLVRVGEPDQPLKWDLWLLAHPDVRRSARVHAFFEFAASGIPEYLPKETG